MECNIYAYGNPPYHIVEELCRTNRDGENGEESLELRERFRVLSKPKYPNGLGF